MAISTKTKVWHLAPLTSRSLGQVPSVGLPVHYQVTEVHQTHLIAKPITGGRTVMISTDHTHKTKQEALRASIKDVLHYKTRLDTEQEACRTYLSNLKSQLT